MRISIDGRAAFFYTGTGVGNYSNQIIKNISKINTSHLINIISCKNNNNLSFWEFTNKNIYVKKNTDVFFNPHNGIGLPCYNTKKIITTLHDIIPSKMPETVSDTYLKIYNENIHSIIKKSHTILTVSNFSKKDIVNTFNVSPDKIKVTYLAPDPIYKPLNKFFSKNLLFKKYKINFEYILYLGGFSPRKNIIGLINSFSKIHEKNKNIKLLILGNKGKSYEIYKEKVEKLNMTNSIYFTDFIKTIDLPYFYNAASIFIYPSFYEGFGLPPIEAMACNTPVIASNSTSIPEILKNAPLYIDPYNIDDISNKINLLLNDTNLRKKISTNGFNHSKNFSWEKTSIKTLNFIENIKEP